MARKLFGTNQFSGLNTRQAPHLLPDSALTRSLNVSWSEYGAVSPSKDAVQIYSRSGVPQGYNICRYNDADHHLFKTDQIVYEDNVAIYDSENDNEAYFVSDKDNVYCFDGVANKVWNGERIRNLGPLVPVESGADNLINVNGALGTTAILAIAGITKATTPVVTVNDLGDIEAGERVYIYGVSGMTEINGQSSTISNINVGAKTFELDEIDTSGYGTWTSGGYVRYNLAGLSGHYGYRVTYVVTLEDNREIESSAEVLLNGATASEDGVDLVETDQVQVVIREVSAAELLAYASDLSGIDLKARVYRTKSGGSDHYLLAEIEDPQIIGSSAYTFFDETSDLDLTTLLTFKYDSHDIPPTVALATVAQQKLYLVDADNRNRLYWSSGLAQFDYVDPLSYVALPEKIEAIGRFNDTPILFSRGRIWRWTQLGEADGHLEDIDTPAGTDLPNSVVETPYGLLFANSRGLWVFDGARVAELSDTIFDEWSTEVGDWRGAYADNKAFFSQGTESGEYSYSLTRYGDVSAWSQELPSMSGPPAYLAADSESKYLYGHGHLGIYRLYAGEDASINMTTKHFGDGRYRRAYRLILDLDSGGRTVSWQVDTTRGQSVAGYEPSSGSGIAYGRRVLWWGLPANLRGEYFYINIAGKCNVYGCWLVLVGAQ